MEYRQLVDLEFQLGYNSGMRRNRVETEVYLQLYDLLLSNQFKPGERLPDRKLAEKLGVSRTPVRQALSRLEQAGLVANPLGRGYVVVELNAKQIADLYDLREVLEGYAIRLAVEHATPEDLDELAQVLARLETYRALPEKRSEEIKEGLRVHECIGRLSGNAFLHEILVRLLDRMRGFIWVEMLYEDAEAAEFSRQEHAAFLTLVRQRRADEAEALVRGHIRTAKEHILRVVKARESFYEPAASAVAQIQK